MFSQIILLFTVFMIVLGNIDGGTIQFSSTEFPFNFKQVNEFLNRTSYEAVTVMVFFQVIAVSFIVGKISTLYLLMWVAFSFLVYSIAGPYFCLKWLLLISSLMWHSCVFLWTHPYLVACSVIFYGLHFIFWNIIPEENRDLKEDLVLQKLKEIDCKTSVLHEEMLQLTQSVAFLMMHTTTRLEKGDYIEEWLTDIPYPLDKKTEAPGKNT